MSYTVRLDCTRQLNTYNIADSKHSLYYNIIEASGDPSNVPLHLAGRSREQLLEVLLQRCKHYKIRKGELMKWSTYCTVRTCLDAEWGSGRRVAVHDMPFLVNQELGEVPLDAVAEKTTFARLQELV